jgi:hypothetical protein
VLEYANTRRSSVECQSRFNILVARARNRSGDKRVLRAKNFFSTSPTSVGAAQAQPFCCDAK